jgi:hypothetical protein
MTAAATSRQRGRERLIRMQLRHDDLGLHSAIGVLLPRHLDILIPAVPVVARDDVPVASEVTPCVVLGVVGGAGACRNIGVQQHADEVVTRIMARTNHTETMSRVSWTSVAVR